MASNKLGNYYKRFKKNISLIKEVLQGEQLDKEQLNHNEDFIKIFGRSEVNGVDNKQIKIINQIYNEKHK